MKNIIRAAILFTLVLSASVASAQDFSRTSGPLSAAMKAYAVTAALDAGTTYTNLSRGAVETNPILLSIGRNNPIATTGLLVASDIGALYAWKRIADAGHPRLAVAALVGSAVFRGFVVHHNVRTLEAIR